MLIGEGAYNLNVLKEIKVTESYIGLDQEVTKCQSKESFYTCTTRNYIDAIVAQCKCLPLTVRVSDKVHFYIFDFIYFVIYNSLFRNPFVVLQKIWNV